MQKIKKKNFMKKFTKKNFWAQLQTDGTNHCISAY